MFKEYHSCKKSYVIYSKCLLRRINNQGPPAILHYENVDIHNFSTNYYHSTQKNAARRTLKLPIVEVNA